jgi:two-component sensor histidine kinase
VAVPGDPWAAARVRHAARTVHKTRLSLAISMDANAQVKLQRRWKWRLEAKFFLSLWDEMHGVEEAGA